MVQIYQTNGDFHAFSSIHSWKHSQIDDWYIGSLLMGCTVLSAKMSSFFTFLHFLHLVLILIFMWFLSVLVLIWFLLWNKYCFWPVAQYCDDKVVIARSFQIFLHFFFAFVLFVFLPTGCPWWIIEDKGTLSWIIAWFFFHLYCWVLNEDSSSSKPKTKVQRPHDRECLDFYWHSVCPPLRPAGMFWLLPYILS